MLESEVGVLEGRRYAQRLKMAGLPHHKTLDEFDASFQPELDPKRIAELRSLRFVERKVSCLILGPPVLGSHCTFGATLLGVTGDHDLGDQSAQQLLAIAGGGAARLPKSRQLAGQLRKPLSLLACERRRPTLESQKKGLALKRRRCRAPHLTMRLAKRPLWHTRPRHVPVLRYGRTVLFRYHGPRKELAKAKLRLAISPRTRKPPWGPR